MEGNGTIRVVHVEDSSEWLDRVKLTLELCPNVRVHPARTAHELYRINTLVPGYEAALYVLDRHFPEAEGGHVRDNWAPVAEFLRKMAPKSPIFMLSSVACNDGVWRKHRNIVGFQLKQTFDCDKFRDSVAPYLFGGED